MSPIIWGSLPLPMPLNSSWSLLADSEAAANVSAEPGWGCVVAPVPDRAGAVPRPGEAAGVSVGPCIGDPAGGAAVPPAGAADKEAGAGLLGCADAWVRRTQRS